jgi:hypothetical protein
MVQIITRNMYTDPAFRVKAVDLINAFNCLRRRPIWDGVRSKVPGLLPYFTYAYGRPTPIYFMTGDKVCMCATGCRQGDPLGPLLFALGIHDKLEAIQRQFPNHLSLAFLDDLTIVGPEEPTLMGRVAQLFGEVGLRINYNKTQIFQPSVPHADPAQHGVIILGTAVGSDEFIDAHVAKMVEKYLRVVQSFFNLGAPYAFALLSNCICSRPNFLARTSPPSITNDRLAHFDAEVDRALLRLMSTGHQALPDPAFVLRGLPVEDGGLGLRRMKDVHKYAYVASLLDTIYFVAEHMPEVVKDRYFRLSAEVFEPMLAVVRDVHEAAVNERGFVALDPTAPADVVRTRPPVQKSLVSVHYNAQIRDLKAQLAETDPPGLAYWQSSSDKRASFWLRCITQRSRQLHLSNEDFIYCLRLRLLIPLSATVPEPHRVECADCRTAQWPDDTHEKFHGLTCHRVQDLVIDRHDKVTDQVALALQRRFGRENVTKEPPMPAPGQEGRRADVLKRGIGNSRTFFDVVIANPCGVTSLTAHRSAQVILAAAVAAEREKNNDYRVRMNMVEHANSTFVAAAFELTGREGPAIKEYFEGLIGQADPPMRQQVKRTIEYSRRAINVSLAKSAAAMVKQYERNRLEIRVQD